MTELKQDDLDKYRKGFSKGWRDGRESYKGDVIEIIKPCLSRDFTLSKLLKVIEDLV